MKMLTVVSPFADHARGAQITDPAEVASALEQHEDAVVASEVPDPEVSDPPKPASKSAD